MMTNSTTRTEPLGHPIPPMIHPLGRHWSQPLRASIYVEGREAYMDRTTFDELLEYSTSLPTGMYAGKMWRACIGGVWWLRWYCDTPPSPIEADDELAGCWVVSKRIRLSDAHIRTLPVTRQRRLDRRPWFPRPRSGFGLPAGMPWFALLLLLALGVGLGVTIAGWLT